MFQIVLYVILALLPPVLQFQLPSLLFFCLFFIRFVLLFVVEPKQKQGQRLVDHKLVETSSNFIAGRPMAALLFRFLCDFKCCVSLFIVILVMFKYRNR